MPNREPWPSVEAPVPEQPARLEDDFGDWDCAACGNTVSACSWFRDGDTTCCDKCDHNEKENTMSNRLPPEVIAGLRRDNEEAKPKGWRAEVGVDDLDLLLDAVAAAPPSQYGLQVLVNADSRSARWAFHEDYPLADSEADAWRYLKDALDSGYAPHHLRVVALHVVEPR